MINYGDRVIVLILLLFNYLLIFVLKGDVKEIGGGYMVDVKVYFFIVVF